ncbi:hypothetical protein [Polymorphospora rubra]|uniref:Uncharacterized protein n=1 Tax=Polymorphospora rubra TaxID=338584 RepID=A0A810MSK0_9ACTN|nr:hypothetical protein [Polymorphospora rubra]BCJ64167.1 hypothetical protein Prubr_11880 [Polymorphospora rubra]
MFRRIAERRLERRLAHALRSINPAYPPRSVRRARRIVKVGVIAVVTALVSVVPAAILTSAATALPVTALIAFVGGVSALLADEYASRKGF